MTISDRVRVKDVRLLSDNYYVLKTTTFEFRRANGEWQTSQRETYDRGNCATVLRFESAPKPRRTGYRLGGIQKIFEAFMSPGSVTEKQYFFVAEYDPAMRISFGGGLADEGEDIEVLELSIDEALAMIADGRIVDAKTIMLLQYAALNIFR